MQEQKPKIGKELPGQRTRRAAMMNRHDTTEKNIEPLTAPAKNWRFGASYDSFVVEQTVVLPTEICGVNSQLLVAANYCA